MIGIILLFIVLLLFVSVRLFRKSDEYIDYNNGYWNGESTAKFRVVVAVVGDQPKEMEEHFKKFNPGKKNNTCGLCLL